MSDWTSWSSCQATCGGPFSQTRHRSKTTKEANGGSCSDDSTSETQQCGAADPCPVPGKQPQNGLILKSLHWQLDSIYLQLHFISPVNCIMSEWSSWSSCQATCGVPLKQIKTRSKTTEEANGGTCLDDSTTETQQCGADPCPGKPLKNGMQLSRFHRQLSPRLKLRLKSCLVL